MQVNRYIASGTAPGYRIEAGVASDVGCERTENEDRMVYFEPEDPVQRARQGACAVLADGMGGHMGGAYASRVAVDRVLSAYYAQAGDRVAALRRAFVVANDEIHRLSFSSDEYKGMGATCTACLFDASTAYCAHVGDTRLYLIRGGELRLMTEDHSMVGEMVKAGILTREQARRHPDRHRVSRSLGLRPEVEIYSWQEPLALCAGDCFVLCSDGLYDPLVDDEIRELALAGPPAAACGRMIDLAKARGGHDNISVGLFRVCPIG
ncbi:MAG: PP2C family protein-serine/threonine phosphatase [Gammaproteobacteria bacterium]